MSDIRSFFAPRSSGATKAKKEETAKVGKSMEIDEEEEELGKRSEAPVVTSSSASKRRRIRRNIVETDDESEYGSGSDDKQENCALVTNSAKNEKPVEKEGKGPVVEKGEEEKEPASEKKEPVAEKQELVVEKGEEKEEPVAEKKEPAAEKQELVVKKGEDKDTADPCDDMEEDAAGSGDEDAAEETKSADKKPKATSAAASSKGKSSSLKEKAEEELESYDPVKGAGWASGEPMPYSVVADAFQKIDATTKRLEIQCILTKLFRSIITVGSQDLLAAVYLCCNKLAPSFEGIELGIGDSLLIKAICRANGREVKAVKNHLEKEGDLGLVAEKSKKNQPSLFGFKPKALTLRAVYDSLMWIAKQSGNKSQDRKVGKIQKLLVACSPVEARFIVRALQGKLRIGLAQQTVLISVAHAFAFGDREGNERVDSEKAVEIVKQAFSELPTFGEIIPALLKDGLLKLPEVCHLRPGIPVNPMLAKPTNGVQEVLDKFTGIKFTCEFKYDGERAQIHMLENGEIHVYSRNGESNTTKYPDVITTMPQALKKKGMTSFIIDSEVVAYDLKKQCLLPFQILSTRARKDAKVEDLKVQVIVCAFDMLYLNGESLLQKPLCERRAILHESFQEVENKFTFAKTMESDDVEDIGTFLNLAVKENCEGLMVKTLEQDASYQPAKRSLNWLKLKKDYMDGLADALDLVPIGAYKGRGKRTGVYGGFLLACYDEDEEEYQSICKIGTGFSEQSLKEFMEFFKDHIIDEPEMGYVVDDALEPDVWFSPVTVWEVRAADLSISPKHKAALGKIDPSKGIALRFPRFLRIRDDKTPTQATNATQVADMYTDQGLATQSKMDDDFFD